MQVMPTSAKVKKMYLYDPYTNVMEGTRILSEAKKSCKHKKDMTFVVCFNVGVKGGDKIRYPRLFPYYKKVKASYQ